MKIPWLKFTYKDWLNKNKMANANDSGDEEEECETGNQDNSYRLKVIGTKRRNCKYMHPNNYVHVHCIKLKTAWISLLNTCNFICLGHTKLKEEDDQKRNRRELKYKEEILKQRKIKAKKQAYQNHRQTQRQSRQKFKVQKSRKKHWYCITFWSFSLNVLDI